MLKKLNINDNLYVYFAVFSAFFFSFIPLNYLLSFTGFDKRLTYVIFTFVTLLIMAFYAYRNILQINKHSIIVFLLSLFFAAYAAISYALTINYFNDYQTIVAVSLLNPLYVMLAALIADKKRHIIIFIYLLVSTYFFAALWTWLQGDLKPAKDSIFIPIFPNIGEEFYQNINNYLGLMPILTLGLLTKRSWLINTLKLCVIVLSIFFMLKVGGRSPIVALGVILIFWFLLLKINLENGSLLLMIIIIIIFSYALLITMDKLIIMMLESDATTVNRFAYLIIGTDSSHREFLFANALDLFTSDWKTLLFGAGINYFSIFTKEYDINLYPHNIILEVLAEYGIIGFILFLLPVFYLFRIRRITYGNYIGNTPLNQLFFIIFLYFLTIQMFTGSLRNIWFFVFITFLLLPSSPKYHHSQSPTRQQYDQKIPKKTPKKIKL